MQEQKPGSKLGGEQGGGSRAAGFSSGSSFLGISNWGTAGHLPPPQASSVWEGAPAIPATRKGATAGFLETARIS